MTVKTKWRNILIRVLLLSMCFFMYTPCLAEEYIQEDKRVLFISSYSWATVPKQIEGLQSALGDSYIINYEFMDTKNTVYSDGYQEFRDLLKYKLSQRDDYDAVVVGDDAALNFIMQYQEDLFPETPIVFEGIDNVDNAIKDSENPYVTGVAEIVDYQKNIEIAKKLLPNANKLVFILDDAENGVGIQKQLADSQSEFADYEVEYVNSADYSQKELCAKISSFDSSYIGFCISMSRRNDGVIYTEDERYRILENYANIPLFRVSSSGLGSCNALVGGYIVSHKDSGEIAGSIIKRALEGENIADIPVVLDTPSEYCFNWEVLLKYNLNTSVLPKETVYLNKEPSFVEKHYNPIIFGCCMLALILLLLLFINARNNGKKEKALNKQLDESNHALNDRNDELTKSNAELERISTYKSDFLSRVSHDIRTPMNTILNLTKMVEGELDDKQTALNDLHKIDTSNQFLLSLVNDILDMSRIEQKKIVLQPERYNYHEFLDYMESTFIPLGQAKNVQLTIEEGKQDINIIIDKVRFNQMCFNLVSNAIKYTPEGGHVLFRMAHGEIVDGKFPCDIYVIDDGIGMSKEFQKTMFEPFSQEGRSYKTVEGTGLGLAIVSEIAELLGATIEVDSTIGIGTTFHINMTMVMASDSPEEISEEKESFDKLIGQNILVAEDHPLNQEIIRRLLEAKGMHVTITDNGQQVLDEFTKNPDCYVAILMDVRMPEMDGLTATQKIRSLEIPEAKTIPIIAMTASAYQEDMRDSSNAGMNAHLIKPINPDLLYKELKRQIFTNKEK